MVESTSLMDSSPGEDVEVGLRLHYFELDTILEGEPYVGFRGVRRPSEAAGDGEVVKESEGEGALEFGEDHGLEVLGGQAWEFEEEEHLRGRESEPVQVIKNFLSDSDYTFVVVEVEGEVKKLEDGYKLAVENTVDLRGLAAEKLKMEELRNTGLKGLAREVLDLEMEKLKEVTLSRRDDWWLTDDQVQCACVDAFVSFEIGRILNACR